MGGTAGKCNTYYAETMRKIKSARCGGQGGRGEAAPFARFRRLSTSGLRHGAEIREAGKRGEQDLPPKFCPNHVYDALPRALPTVSAEEAVAQLSRKCAEHCTSTMRNTKLYVENHFPTFAQSAPLFAQAMNDGKTQWICL